MSQNLTDRALGGPALAYRIDGGGDEVGRCGFLFLGGFKSEMTGKKGEALAELARATRRRTLRFDYSGHGASAGKFTDGTISAWAEQAMHMYLAHTRSKIVVVGSSMGGWLALHLARRLKLEDPVGHRRLAGLVLLAPAADMTQDLMWDKFDEKTRNQLRDTGLYLEPSAYGEPYEITAKLLADGEQHLMLRDGVTVDVPVRILQGTEDAEVPPSHAAKTFNAIKGEDVTITYIKGADHRLSTPTQIKMICDTALNLADRVDGV